MSEELQEALDGFFLAAEYGRSDVIKALADHGRGHLSLANVVDPVTGRSPLHVAVASGKKDALRVLLAAGFPPAHQSKKQEGQDDRNRVRQLLKAGVDVSITDAATGGTLLHWAASCQAVDVMKYLLEREDVQSQTLINARNGEGATPLHLACHADQVECTQMLLLHQADVSLRGDKGISKDKTALELATKQEVKELFSHGLSQSDEGDKSMEVHVKDEVEADESGEPRLEEKDLLVNQLKKSIEALVQESQEIQMLGEERIMLDYVRKLRDEKAVVQRQLEDATVYIKDQQQQLDSLKEQMRQMATVDKQIETDHDILSHTSDGTASSVAGGPPDSTHSNMSVMDLHQLEKPVDEEDEGPQKPPAQPLKLDAWTSKAQREQETFHRYVEKHGPDIWSTVWNGIWTGGEDKEVQDEDGEVIMTV
ncbi:hypothetical protein PInf_025451 [Phytophthora infestans]|nr:hypothetical protein PInf_025451 [Phytophthora infestans]